jgi:hypothetical protein
MPSISAARAAESADEDTPRASASTSQTTSAVHVPEARSERRTSVNANSWAPAAAGRTARTPATSQELADERRRGMSLGG